MDLTQADTDTQRITGAFASGTPYEILYRQPGTTIYLVENSYIIKIGELVTKAEKVAMDLVYEAGIPLGAAWYYGKYDEGCGRLDMELVEGISLKTAWPLLNTATKTQLCRKIWDLVGQWRRKISRPHNFPPGACAADGSWPENVLFGYSEEDPAVTTTSLRTDIEIQQHIAQQYHRKFGRRYTIAEIVDMLPSSSEFVFTHPDIAPRNIMVKQTDTETWVLTSIIDWENAGFYPSYWEYINIWKPSPGNFEDWQEVMDDTAPQECKCALDGVKIVRRILF